jgi:hypothetical protein
MSYKWKPRRYQRGGALKISGWVAMLLLSLAAAEGVYIRYLQSELQQLRLQEILSASPSQET